MSETMSSTIYHACDGALWDEAQESGTYRGSADDLRDGYIHFSTAVQLRVSVTKHRAGQDGLVLLTVDAARLGDALRWEPSRDGQLFPHLYGTLPVAAVVRKESLPLDAGGVRKFPGWLP